MNAKRKLALPSSGRKIWVDFGLSYTVQMGVADWIALHDHPRQRDTARQARKADWQAARTAQGPAFEAQRFVVAGEFQGEIYKVDGHTRGLLWARGELRPPPFVVATVFRCETLAELSKIYDTHHASLAAPTQSDQVAGAYREQGIQIASERLRGGHIYEALRIAWGAIKEKPARRKINTYAAVAYFAPELKLLDMADARNDSFYTGVVSAALLALAADATTFEFFRRIAACEGSKQGKILDPVEAVIAAMRAHKRKSKVREHAQQENLCWRTLRAWQIWQQGADSSDYWCDALPEPLNAAHRDLLIARIKLKKDTATGIRESSDSLRP
jgi:hypothetical protein